jgi:hypothetical protein
MDDKFIDDLKAAWQMQDHDAAAVLDRLRRNRWRPHFALAAEMLGCVVALLAGIWFAWVAAHTDQHRLLFGLGAGVMLVTVPVLTVASLLARRASFAWDDESPQTLLRIGVRRAEAALQSLRLWRWHVWIVAAFVSILWALELSQLIQAFGFLVFYTAVCLAVSLAAWIWMRWREDRIRSERDACARLLAAIELGDSIDERLVRVPPPGAPRHGP